MKTKENNVVINHKVLDMLVLCVLNTKDCYGYEIYKILTEYSDNKIDFVQNRIYTSLYSLSQKGLLSEYKKQYSEKSYHNYYHLNPIGEVYLNRLLNSFSLELSEINTIVYKLEKNQTPQGLL